MEWFRHYHGLCTDPKLHKISRNAKVSRAIIIAAWCAVLEHASQQEIRGDVSDIEPADLAFLIDQKPSVAQRIWDAILASDLIVNGRVAAWEKRQKISDDGKIRVQKYRASKTKPLPENETETPGNVTLRTRTEQNRTDKESTNVDSADTSAPPSKPLPLRERYPPFAKLPMNGKGKHYPDEYEAAWRAYPTRREDTKPACYKHWRRWVVEQRVDPGEITMAAERCGRNGSAGEYQIGFRRWCDEGLWGERDERQPVSRSPQRALMPGEW